MKQNCISSSCLENKGMSDCEDLKEAIAFLQRCFSAQLVKQSNRFFHLRFTSNLSVLYFMEKAKVQFPCLNNCLILFEHKWHNPNPTFVFHGNADIRLTLNHKFGGCLTGQYWILADSKRCDIKEVLDVLKGRLF